jgi:conjugal transfer pilus assembly protein TraU
MRRRARIAGLALAVVAGLLGGPSRAQSTGCDDASLFSASLLTAICWDCIFPIRIAGAAIGAGSGEVPRKASDRAICLCQDSLSVPHVGVTISLWEPARLIELVRNPGCSPVLGGLRLPSAGSRRMGGMGEALHSQGASAFMHYHVWSLPLLVMLDLFVVDRCVQDGYLDLDLMFLSELDPTWAFDELAFWTTPEIALTSNPIVQAACVGDAIAANADEPLDELFWCAGSWGGLYPLVGTTLAPDSAPEVTSLLAMRSLAAMHRRGLSWRTMGSDTLCRGKIDPFLPKTQYAMSMWHPVAEARGKHALGESTLTWGDWRNVPGEGDAVYIAWRWNDCCTASR